MPWECGQILQGKYVRVVFLISTTLAVAGIYSFYIQPQNTSKSFTGMLNFQKKSTFLLIHGNGPHGVARNNAWYTLGNNSSALLRCELKTTPPLQEMIFSGN